MKAQHLLILIAAIVFIHFYSKAQKKSSPHVIARKWMIGGYNALTIPPFGVFVHQDHEQNTALIEHELVHWRQYQQLGLFGYYTHYFLKHLQYGYDGNPMEREARFAESDYCKLNYTECVRSGMAKTISNPAFRA